MNEKPESIWKKSWKGWRGLLAWVAVMTVTVALVFFCIGLAIHIQSETGQIAEFALLSAAGLALATGVLFAFIRWLCCWKNFRRFLFACACFITLVALFYAEEDWRGKHDWENFKRQWEAKGEHFSFASIIPPPVPNDQNFAFSPVWMAEVRNLFQSDPQRIEGWYGDRIYSTEVSNLLSLLPVTVSGVTGTNYWYQPRATPEESGNWATAQMTDLKPWQAYYRDLEKTNRQAAIPITPQPKSPAADVLLALSKFDPVIDKLLQDSARTYSRFPLDYTSEDPAAILLPHLSALKQVAQVLQLRAIADLQIGQSDRSLAEVKLMLRLADSLRTEPFIISQLVRFAIFQIAVQPIYEGLAEHKWSDRQLTELDADLSGLDFLAAYELSIRGERAAHVKLIDYLEQKRSRFEELSEWFDNEHERQRNSMNNLLIFAMAYIGPKGWYYQNDLVMARMLQQQDLPVVNDQQQTVSPRKAAFADETISSLNIKQPNPYSFLVRFLTPYLGPFAQKAAYGQNALDLARVAIALERFRLAHGQYPESLDALTPEYLARLPHDIINGQPLHYRQTTDGQFVLYSVGWNEKDDGGVVAYGGRSSPRDESNSSVDISKGDWVWRYPKR